jgi:hypothetical protein
MNDVAGNTQTIEVVGSTEAASSDKTEYVVRARSRQGLAIAKRVAEALDALSSKRILCTADVDKCVICAIISLATACESRCPVNNTVGSWMC